MKIIAKNLPARDGEKYFIELEIFVMSSRVNVPCLFTLFMFLWKVISSKLLDFYGDEECD